MDPRKDIFEIIFNQAPLGVYTLDKTGVIDSFNPEMVKISGTKSADEVIGLNVFSMESYKDSGLIDFFASGLRGKYFETEVKYLSQTGKKESWRHYRGVPLFSEEKTVEGLLLLVEDITERKRLQAELEGYTKNLEEEIRKRIKEISTLEKQYEIVIEKSLIGISILKNGVYDYVNPALFRMFGFDKKEEMVGLKWQDIVFGEDIGFVISTGIEERIKGLGSEKQFQFRGKKRDGTMIFIEVLSVPTFIGSDPVILGFFRDITKDKKTEEQEKRHLSELEKMNKLMINREIKMIELKKKIKELENSCK